MLAYNPAFVIFIAILFNVLTAIVVTGILEYRGRLKKNIITVQSPKDCTVTYFPKFFSNRAIVCYVATLLITSAFFLNRTMPFQFIAFGFAFIFIFFYYSSRLTMSWRKYSPSSFMRKLFFTALFIRIAYVLFIYFYFIQMTGIPHAFHKGDEGMYQYMGELWRLYGLDVFLEQMNEFVSFSDAGYCWWLAIEYRLLGTHVLTARLLKCFIDAFSCVLIYNLAERNFGEPAARIAAVFYMLMPNMWYYCGITLKETEMAFLTILFVERTDMVMRSPKIKIKDLFLPLLIIVIMFTFRTALAAVLVAAMITALVLSSGKQLPIWRKIVYGSVLGACMFFAIGSELVEEAQQLWAGRTENQEVGYQWRAERIGGNVYAKYASASIFAPLIFTIPFSTMVNVMWQENQMMMNGANFTKNIMSGFTIFALFLMLFRGDWRKHVLPIAVTCGYLVVLVFSNFAHSERFHFPVLGFELMFAAYGITQMTNRHKRWYTIWIVFVCMANVLWALIKLRGRGLA